ncbi:MAG: helix-turn-helix domain-containing protein [Caldilineae bacterium]|nr:helix-turn-helix domain-containing protein [Caldilineae bacterium]
MKDLKAILKRSAESGQNIVLDGADLVSQRGYTIIPNYVLYTSRLSAHAKLVYSVLLSYAWNKNAVFPGQSRLAEECGLGLSTVKRALRELKAAQFITVIRRGLCRTNVYVLHFRKR